MRLAVISDIHLGDSSSSMAVSDPQTHAVRLGVGYQQLRDTIRAQFSGEPLDYLVLLGDILDFSVTHYSDAYKIGRSFFQRLADDGLLKKRETEDGTTYGPIIYVCGNHDIDLWNTVEYQVNIINKLQKRKTSEPLRMSIPAIIRDIPDGGSAEVILHGVGSGEFPKYGGLFVDQLTDPPTNFYFGFPNLYLVSEHGTVLMTHGQYLNFYWSVLGAWGVDVLGNDLNLKQKGELDLMEMVGINHPTGQLGCAALGQAGPLTDIVRRLEHDMKGRDMARLDRYLTNLRRKLSRDRGGCKRVLSNLLGSLLQRYIINQFQKTPPARWNEGFLQDEQVWKRFLRFYFSSLYELEELNTEYTFRLPNPDRMIFGHTHQPVSWEAPQEYSVPKHRSVPARTFLVSNTGGWLRHASGKGPGAEIFFYETGKGFSSKRIHYEPSNKPG